MRAFSKVAVLALCLAAFEAKLAQGLETRGFMDDFFASDSGSDAATGAVVDHAAKKFGVDDVDEILGDDKPVKDDNPFKDMLKDDEDDQDNKKDGEKKDEGKKNDEHNKPTTTTASNYEAMPSTTGSSTSTSSSAALPTPSFPFTNTTDFWKESKPGHVGPKIVMQTGSVSNCRTSDGSSTGIRITNGTCIGGESTPSSTSALSFDSSSAIAHNSSFTANITSALHSAASSITSVKSNNLIGADSTLASNSTHSWNTTHTWNSTHVYGSTLRGNTSFTSSANSSKATELHSKAGSRTSTESFTYDPHNTADALREQGYNSTGSNIQSSISVGSASSAAGKNGSAATPSRKGSLFDSGANGHLVLEEAFGCAWALVMVVAGAVVLL
ncbi:hypothetical protein CAC42_1429 [Sphaceloma murrayae]|uniref:Uncharacterized protein n=1 Tax=Sphaceloma murrayae TaxID=2082308 RepID=A0A2K1QFN3_9PEZI|nr:hypothetical protein CAC42_1429 [Sphaceloma murrayae]